MTPRGAASVLQEKLLLGRRFYTQRSGGHAYKAMSRVGSTVILARDAAGMSRAQEVNDARRSVTIEAVPYGGSGGGDRILLSTGLDGWAADCSPHPRSGRAPPDGYPT